jgi:LmbE family N-acetylglucosaminyl deacetylase
MIESEAIPYDASPLLGERLLVLAPHPDDEVIGCGGVVAQHLASCRAVRIVIATDGAAAADVVDRAAYSEQRERETRAGLDALGAATDLTIRFLGYPDRSLAAHTDALQRDLADELTTFAPDLVLAPSPIEIHPDHSALADALARLIAADAALAATRAVTRIAFYEIGMPIRPNVLVDITAVAERKWAAIASHESQTSIRDYTAFARGLNAYRTMTLSPEATAAEAYWVTTLPSLRTLPISTLRSQIGAPPAVSIVRETLPISVIVRTKDRPALLQEALASIRANEHPAEIVVVNDGGAAIEAGDARVVTHASSLGRSAAMNSGVEAASAQYLAFLDDDDLFFPEHLTTLAAAATAAPAHAAWYSDALSSFLSIASSGAYETHSKLRIFARDYDRDLLLADNYIPLPTLLVRRDTYLAAGGFDPSFDLFEDWDFLIRISRRGSLLHVPRLTCEIRHFAAGSSIVLAAPEGSPRFREAKLRVWKKHADLLTLDVFANALETEKRELVANSSAAVEARGRAAHMERDLARLDREKTTLLAEMGALHAAIGERELRLHEAAGAERALRQLLSDAEHTREQHARDAAEVRAAMETTQRHVAELYAEIGRLNALLEQIYASRTWKLHTTLQRMKGAT